jgi:hypothetical protein
MIAGVRGSPRLGAVKLFERGFLVLTVPEDDSDCAAIVDVNALAYGMDLEASKAAIGSRTFWKNRGSWSNTDRQIAV